MVYYPCDFGPHDALHVEILILPNWRIDCMSMDHVGTRGTRAIGITCITVYRYNASSGQPVQCSQLCQKPESLLSSPRASSSACFSKDMCEAYILSVDNFEYLTHDTADVSP